MAEEDLSNQKKELLVAGYTHQDKEQLVPNALINMFVAYYDVTTYWKLNHQVLQQFDVAEIGDAFYSETIQYHHTDIAWRLYILPKGFDDDEEESPYFRAGIAMNELPLNVHSIAALVRIDIFGDEHKHLFHNKGSHSLRSDYLAPAECESKIDSSIMTINDSIEVCCYLEILHIEYKEGINGDKHGFIPKEVKLDKHIRYEWKISDELLQEFKRFIVGKRYTSDMFGIVNNWILHYKADGKDAESADDVVLGFELLRIPNEIKLLKMDYELELQTDENEPVKFREIAEVSYESNNWVWLENTFSTELLSQCTSMVVVITMDILEIYDYNDQQIENWTPYT